MRILLIEDEPLLGEAVAAHLHKLHAVDWMQSLEAASEAMRTVEYDLVLLDLNLPDGHGLDLQPRFESPDSPSPSSSLRRAIRCGTAFRV